MPFSILSPSAIASGSLSLLFFPFLVLLSLVLIPLAIITTCLAVCALTFRATLVYVELLAALVRHRPRYDHGEVRFQVSNDKDGIEEKVLVHPTGATSKYGCRKSSRRESTHEISSAAQANSRGNLYSKNGVFPQQSLVVYNGFFDERNEALPSRDFEGIGGWRSVEPPVTRGEQDSASIGSSQFQWPMINSRLELPNPDPITSARPKTDDNRASAAKRKHKRSATAGQFEPRVSYTSNGDIGSGNIYHSQRPKSMVMLGDVEWSQMTTAEAPDKQGQSSNRTKQQATISNTNQSQDRYKDDEIRVGRARTSSCDDSDNTLASGGQEEVTMFIQE